MIDERFYELVNLYLDREIQEGDLRLLEAEISQNPIRRREFETNCRMHITMQKLLGEEEGALSVNNLAPQVSKSKSVSKLLRHAPAISIGLAACAALGFVFFVPVVSTSGNAVAFDEGVLEDGDSLPRIQEGRVIKRSNLKRFVARREAPVKRSTSLAAELRLIGLSPKMASHTENLRKVETVQLERKRVSRVRVLTEMSNFSSVPEPKLLQMQDPVYESNARFITPTSRSRIMPSFKTSLASY